MLHVEALPSCVRYRTFSVQAITAGDDAMKTDGAIWYVSFALRDPDPGHQRFARQSRSFANEEAAKAFARTLLDRTNNISAGTINPHVPRRVIAPAAIVDWVGDR
jgi:hypothetical protein